MRIDYGVTGKRRKALAKAVSDVINTSFEYLGVPTFSYGIGDYHIDKNGILTGPDNPGLIQELLRRYDLVATCKEYYPSSSEAENSIEQDDFIYLNIEMPRSSFTDNAIENLRRLIKSKETLIKKALGVSSLKVVITDEKVSFPWFLRECTPDEIKAYTYFVTALSDMAKSQTRINSAERVAENEKYAFRTFLLRLGFIGPEYKKARKILLSKLSGNSAFRDGKLKVITSS
mgnify:CR=1 FL=1